MEPIEDFTPIDDFLYVEDQGDATEVGGVLVHGRTAREFKATEGAVLGVGPGRFMMDSNHVPLPFEVGAWIYWNPAAGASITICGQKILVLHIGDVYGWMRAKPQRAVE